MDTPTEAGPKIEIGMKIEEAEKIGGPYAYTLKRDSKWRPGISPIEIIRAQRTDPDDSHIEMTFTNKTQCDTKESIKFRVTVERGRVTKVDCLYNSGK